MPRRARQPERRAARALPLVLALAVSAALASPTAADEPAPATTRSTLAFTPQQTILSAASAERLTRTVSGVPDRCVWIATGKTAAEAQAIRVALIERNVRPEAIVRAATPSAQSPSASAYCALPEHMTVTFEPSEPALSLAMRFRLAVLAARLVPDDKPLMVRGFATAAETGDPIALAIARAQAARRALIAAGVPAYRIAIEGITREPEATGPRAEVSVR